MQRLDRRWLSALLLASTAGCASVELVPARASQQGEALAIGDGVELRAYTEARPWSVPSTFTPVRISVRNTGARPVFVGLDDIQLASPTVALSAVAAASIPPRRRVASLGTDPASPFVALRGTGGGARAYGGRTESVLLQAAPSSHYPSVLDARDPARRELSSGQFPGGPIESGHMKTGFVYFRGVPRDAGELKLRVFVRPTRDAQPASVVEIVYAVRS